MRQRLHALMVLALLPPIACARATVQPEQPAVVATVSDADRRSLDVEEYLTDEYLASLTYPGCQLFAFSGAFGQAVRIRPPGPEYPDLGPIMAGIPSQVYGALPYIVTIVILAGVVGRSIPPAAVGRPYEKEAHG